MTVPLLALGIVLGGAGLGIIHLAVSRCPGVIYEALACAAGMSLLIDGYLIGRGHTSASTLLQGAGALVAVVAVLLLGLLTAVGVESLLHRRA